MSDTSALLLKTVVAALRGASGITSIVGQRVYADVPDNETFPYLVVMVNTAPYDTKSEIGMEHSLQLNFYSREKTMKEGMDIRTATYNLLHRNETALASVPVDNLQWNGLSNIVKDTDGVTWFGMIQFRAITH